MATSMGRRSRGKRTLREGSQPASGVAFGCPFLSSTVPSATIAWIGISPRDPRRIPGCIAAETCSVDDWQSAGAAGSALLGGVGFIRDEILSRPHEARIVTREPEAHENEDALVGRVFHTGGSYVFEESPFTMIPGSVMNGRYCYDSLGWQDRVI